MHERLRGFAEGFGITDMKLRDLPDSASLRDYSTYDAGKVDRTEQLNRWIMARQHTGK